MNENRSGQIHPVDEMLPTGQLFAYGLQHVLAMYAGAVAVPIIVAQALHLSPMELVHLINADLFSCGIATLIQTLGFWKVGAKIPMIQGVTFASVTPMILIGAEHGITAIYGAIIIAGLFTFLIAPFFSRFIRFFPPVVTGTIITIIGITLLPVAVNWMGGGNPKAPDFCFADEFIPRFHYFSLLSSPFIAAAKAFLDTAIAPLGAIRQLERGCLQIGNRHHSICQRLGGEFIPD